MQSPRLLFDSNPSLHTLSLPLFTAEKAIELFTILQTNTALRALSVVLYDSAFTSNVGTSLQGMLKMNQTLKYLEINDTKISIPGLFLPFLTADHIHNTSLQQLSLFIALSDEIETENFLKFICLKHNIRELKMTFTLKSLCCGKGQTLTAMFYEKVLPAVTKLLQSHTTIRILKLQCFCKYFNDSSQPNRIKLVQHLYINIFIHPSLEYIEITTEYDILSLLKNLSVIKRRH